MASPVRGSKAQPCQGQTSLSPSIVPCPRGPPRCRQTLSIAEIVPRTFATQITCPATLISVACPNGGKSAVEQSRTNSAMRAPVEKNQVYEPLCGVSNLERRSVADLTLSRQRHNGNARYLCTHAHDIHTLPS